MLLFFPVALSSILAIHIIFSRQVHYSLAGFVSSTGLVFAYIFSNQLEQTTVLNLKATAPAILVTLVLTILILVARSLLAADLLGLGNATETSS